MSILVDRFLTLYRDGSRLDALQEKLVRYRDCALQHLFDREKRSVINRRKMLKKELKRTAWKYIKRLAVIGQRRSIACLTALCGITAQDYALEPVIKEDYVSRLHIYIHAAADKNDERRWEHDGNIKRHGHVIIDIFTNKVIYLRLPGQPTVNDNDGCMYDYRQAIKI